MKPILPFLATALLATACTEPEASERAPLPSDADVEAIEAAAKKAAADVTEENADATLDALEAELDAESDG